MTLRVLVIVLLSANVLAAADDPARPVLTDIQAHCQVLGPKWEESYGIRIDDLSSSAGLSEAELEVAAMLQKQLQPVGIVAVADYSCTRSGVLLDVVTVRVFVFDDRLSARDWWQKKYEYTGWEEHYSIVDDAEFPAVDSTQMVKRAVLFGNVWITSHHLRTGDEHLTLLYRILELLTEV